MSKSKQTTRITIRILKKILSILVSFIILISINLAGNLYLAIVLLLLSCILHIWAAPDSIGLRYLYYTYLFAIYFVTKAGYGIWLLTFNVLPDTLTSKILTHIPIFLLTIMQHMVIFFPILFIYLINRFLKKNNNSSNTTKEEDLMNKETKLI